MNRKPVGWNDFVRIPDELADQMDVDEVPGRSRWKSTEYVVTRTELEDGSVWLSLSRFGSRGTVRSWRHLQVIKNVMTDPEREAVEIFPAESRLTDTTDQYHLFVLPEGMRVPYGYAERDVGGPEQAALTGGTQAPFEPGTEPPEGVDATSQLVAEMRAPKMIGPKPLFLAQQEEMLAKIAARDDVTDDERALIQEVLDA